MKLKRLPFLQSFLALAAAPAIGAANEASHAGTAIAAATGAPTAATAMRLYTLDGGRLDFENMGAFCDTGENDGKPGSMAVPCYLIRYGDRWMLWDAGLGDRIAAEPNGEMHFGGRFTVRRTVASQLAELGVKPHDIDYVALSHLHADHVGNIGLFTKATFLVASSDLAWARAEPTPNGVYASLILPLASAHVEASDDDRDVFGDGSVRILKTPGHTPGHRTLCVRLPNFGPLLITGDLYHTRENYEKGLVPGSNTDRADTLASFNRFAGLARNMRARVVIQHSLEDFASMPAFPSYLD